MPYPNVHAARLISPEKFEQKSFKLKKISEGVSLILGKLKGETKMTGQSYRFEKSKFTVTEAKNWLKEHKINNINFEPAEEKKDNIDLVINHFDVFDNTKLLLTDKYSITSEGYLQTRGIVTNTGIFRYLQKDGTVLNELREESEVFNQESMDTLKNKPITDFHPPKLVTVDNINEMQKKGLIIGYTDSNVRCDGHAISVGITITDKDKIKKIKSGEQSAFSCGYQAKLDFSKSGYAFGNNKYDAVQRDIIYNHVALVDQGRAGDLARIRLDSIMADNTVIQIIEKEEGKKMPENLQTMKIDGIEYSVEKDVLKYINSLQTKIDSITKDNSDLLGKKDAFENEVKELKDQIEEIQKVQKSDADIQKAVNERLELQKIADHFNIQYAADDTNKELKLKVIKTKNDKIDLTDKDDVYINAYFDSIVDISKSEIVNKNNAAAHNDYVGSKKDQTNTNKEIRDNWEKNIIQASQMYTGSAHVEENGKIITN